MVYRLDVPSAATTPPPVGTVGAEGFPGPGNPPSTLPPVIDPYFVYALCEEIRNVVVAAGLTPTKSAVNQLQTAIGILIAQKQLFSSVVDTASNYALGPTDNGKYINFTAAETLTLPLTSGIISGYLAGFGNGISAGGVVTVNTNGATVALPSGNVTGTFTLPNLDDFAALLWDGSSSIWRLVDASADILNPAGVGIAARTTIFTSPGNWTAPPGVTTALISMIGGGAGAGIGPVTAGQAGGSGGGSGKCYYKQPVTVVPGTTYVVTPGAAGVGQTVLGTPATAGGASSFGSLLTAAGGSPGAQTTGASGGNPGGAAGGAGGQAGGAGGGTILGPGGTPNGGAGGGYGAGGGGGYSSAQAGGNGSAGVVIVEI